MFGGVKQVNRKIRTVENICPICFEPIGGTEPHETVIQKSSTFNKTVVSGYEIWFHRKCFCKIQGKRWKV